MSKDTIPEHVWESSRFDSTLGPLFFWLQEKYLQGHGLLVYVLVSGGWGRLEREWCQSHNGFNMWTLSSTHWSPSWSLKADRNCLISTSWLHVPHCFEKVQTDWYLHNKIPLAPTMDWWWESHSFAEEWPSHCRSSRSTFLFWPAFLCCQRSLNNDF